jgi:mannitol/fructose-specific phosphotransferase system IIA component (Ntr-type)
MSDDIALWVGFAAIILALLALLALDLGMFHRKALLVEEIIGAAGDEFDIGVTDALALAPERVVLEVSAESIDDAIRRILDHVPPTALPDDRARIARLLARAAGAGALLAQGGVALVHAPVGGREPLLLFGRSDAGVPGPDDGSRVHALFLLLTPSIASALGRDATARLVEMIGSEAVREGLLHAELSRRSWRWFVRAVWLRRADAIPNMPGPTQDLAPVSCNPALLL